MASAMVAQSTSSPVFAPLITHPSVFSKTMMTPLISPPSSPLPLRFSQQQITTDHRGDREMSLLCRKKPASLALPIRSFEFTSSEVSDSIIRGEEVVEVEGEGYGVYSKKGKKRGPSEDRYSAVNYGGVRKKQALFGVFDGHGGAKAAEFAAKRLGKNIMGHVLRNGDDLDVEMAVREGYLETDSAFMGEEEASGGACCVTALIHEGDLVVSNVGDCRAVMSRRGVAEALTSDHKPSVENERSRMQNLGGFVDCFRGVWRIQGTLAVSRSIGDKKLKTWVIGEPETKSLRLSSACEFLILASDGLWDRVSNQEAVDLVRPLLSLDAEKTTTSCVAAKRLAEMAIRRGSLDDTTVMIVRLDQWIS